MSQRIPFPGFVGSAFRSQSLKFDAQDLCNWFLERAGSQHSKAGQALLPCPGFERWVTLPTGPVRGLIAQNNRLFAVGGEFLYEISREGAITKRSMTTLTTPTGPIITNSKLPDAIPAPLTPVVTHGGTLGTTQYIYVVTATTAYGETPASPGGISNYGNAVLSATNWNIVSWTYVEGATGYKVYRMYVNGAYDPRLISVVASTTLVINDIGTTGTQQAPPAGNTTAPPVGSTTYGYKVTATIGTGETPVSPEGVTITGQATLSSTLYNIITWPPVPNARGYRVYRTQGVVKNAAGTSTVTPPRLIAVLGADDLLRFEPGASLNVHDTGKEGDAATPPDINTTGAPPMTDDGYPVSFSTSGDAGNHLLIVSGGTAYCYDLSTDAFAPVVEGATYGGYIDSYFVVLDAGSSTLKVSESLDGFAWDPTQVYQRSRAGDKWLAMAVTSNEIWLIGSQTGEVWVGTGQDAARFAPYPPVFLEAGTIASSSLVRIGGSLMWLAQDIHGAGFVIRTQGYTPTPASPPAVDWAIQNLTVIADAFAYTYQQEGHVFYVLTFPNDDVTWVYDITTNEWHKRGHWDSDLMRFTAYRPQCHAFAFGGIGFGKHLVGDRLTGVIAEMRSTFGYDIDGAVIRRLRQAPHIPNRDVEMTYDRLQMDMDVGLGFITHGEVPLQSYPEAVIGDGAISYYRLGERTKPLVHDFFSGRTGLISGGVTLGYQSVIGDGNSAMYFDGVTGQITSGALTLPKVFSIEAWFTSLIPGGNGGPTFPIWSNVGDPGQPGIDAGVWNGLVSLFIWPVTTSVWGLTRVDDGQWHHAVWANDGVTTSIYVDGKLENSAPHPHPDIVERAFQIGFDAPYWNTHWKGAIDEVAVYPSVLTPAQVARHYAARKPPLYRDPMMMLSYSNDGGRRWGKELWRSAGREGETSIQVAWSRLGTAKDRIFRLVVSDPTPWRVVGAWLELEGS